MIKKAYFKEEWLDKDNFPEFLPWLVYKGKVSTLGAETFASRKIREIFAFREQKLSRIGQNKIFVV